MRFEAGWLVRVPAHDFPSSFSDVHKLADIGAYLILKPVIIPVRIKGTIRYVGIPSGAVLTPPGKEVGPGFVRSYELADDAWIEAKMISTPVLVEDECPLSALVRNKSLPLNEGGCEIRCYRSIEDLNTGLNRRQVALILFGEEFGASGPLTYLWSTHPVLSGLSHDWVSCKCRDPGHLGRLGYVSKPLVFVGDAVVAAEITHSGSFVFFCDCIKDSKTLYLRAIMYSC